ncbi:hypothetical protein NMY22_g18561 [Coprinellus aureogranulatus]|nr:hypothetical protein NMY22_g18561 [Coprinellus aureogranulatus]
MAPDLHEFPAEVLSNIVKLSVTVDRELGAHPDYSDQHPFWTHPYEFGTPARSAVVETYSLLCKSFSIASQQTIMEHIVLLIVEQMD